MNRDLNQTESLAKVGVGLTKDAMLGVTSAYLYYRWKYRGEDIILNRAVSVIQLYV